MRSLFVAFLLLLVVTVQGQTFTCGQCGVFCAVQQCNQYVSQYLCTEGTDQGGCSSDANAWPKDADCTACCNVQSCFGTPSPGPPTPPSSDCPASVCRALAPHPITASQGQRKAAVAQTPSARLTAHRAATLRRVPLRVPPLSVPFWADPILFFSATCAPAVCANTSVLCGALVPRGCARRVRATMPAPTIRPSGPPAGGLAA